MASKEAKKQRGMFVCKANDLIRKTRFDLTTQQQKIILAAISMIRPEDTVHTWYNFSIRQLCEVCGYNITSGRTYYTRLKEDLMKLTERKWCEMPNGDIDSISWIDKVSIKKGQTEVLLRFDEELQPYLFQLKQNYTQYMLADILVFKNKYSIRIYELLKSHIREYKLDRDIVQDIMIDLSELKQSLQTPKSFTKYTDIKRFVIMPAVNEINKKSDKIHIDIEPIMEKGQGRGKVIKINFIITAPHAKQILEADRIKNETLK